MAADQSFSAMVWVFAVAIAIVVGLVLLSVLS
jgi:hypothetical protein